MIARRTSPLSVLALLVRLSVCAASDPDCGSPTYTGFALKSQSSCKSYVYCESGVVTSETTCPEGLLFNGGVGRGGICTWAESVECQAEEESGAATVTVAAATMTQGSAGDKVDNPNDYYCGQSRQDAAAKCIACPSGSLLECEDITHGCFTGITDCAAETSTDQSNSQQDGQTSSSDLLALLNSLANGQTSTATISTAAAATVAASSYVEAPSPAVTGSDSDSDATPQPSISPTLPPWTNAPFVPYRGPDRPKIVIGYYAAWQWYDRNKFADPKNVDFSKYDRINYAFFQPDTQGRIYGTDEWAGEYMGSEGLGERSAWRAKRALFISCHGCLGQHTTHTLTLTHCITFPLSRFRSDPQLLWGEYDYSTTTQIMSGPDRNYFCSWDGPEESQHNCNYHKGDGILSRAKAAGAEVMPSIVSTHESKHLLLLYLLFLLC